MDRAKFYAALSRRDSGVFGTSLSQSQVSALDMMLDEGNAAARREPPAIGSERPCSSQRSLERSYLRKTRQWTVSSFTLIDAASVMGSKRNWLSNPVALDAIISTVPWK